MDTSKHDLAGLFSQLGLDNSVDSINQFIQQHSIDPDIQIYEADFWNESQSSFIYDALEQDADWSEVIDQLDVLLRQ